MPIAIGVMWVKWATPLKLVRQKNIWNVKICGNGSTIAKHVWSFYHCIDFDNSNVIDKGYFRIRKTLEAWHTSATKNADNNSRLIPNHYSTLF